MKKSLLKLLGVAAVTWSAQASAAGIGGINVISALGQPLKADIELVAVSPSEKSSLVARLATPEAYKSAGLDYPSGNKFKFVIENRADGQSYVHATSAQAVNDPFVSLLVELSWSSGKLVREFTFLLDPVGYQAEQPAAAPVQAVAPVSEPSAKPAVAPVAEVVVPAAEKPVVAAEPVATPDAPKPGKEKVVKAAPVKTTVRSTPATDSGDIKVQRGDTLNKIAAQHKTSDVSLERMLVALYRANADQFDGKNMNRIKTGKILRMPDAQTVDSLTQAEANKEIHAQVNDWNAYRQHLASAAPSAAPQQIAQQVSAGTISSQVADKAPVSKETAKEVLKLSKGDAVTDKVAATGKASKQEQKNAAQEDAIAKAKAAEDERAHAALLEKEKQDAQHLLELKAQAAALAQAASAAAASAVIPASSVSATSAVAAESAVVAESAVQAPVKPAAKPVIPPTVLETSLLDQFLSEPMYLGGAAAALLGLGGLGFTLLRRKNKPVAKAKAKSTFVSDEEDIGSVTGRITAPEIPSPETGDFTVQSGSAQAVAGTTSQDDPISEADLFLSFGRDAQAEDILQEALRTAEDKTPIQMKLLEIYAARKDSQAFATVASALKASGDAQAWQQAEAMGRAVDPSNSLYGGADAGVEDSDSATMQTVALAAEPDLSPVSLSRTTDFDVTGAETPAADKTLVFSAEELAAPASSVMDFDVTGTNPAAAVAATSNSVMDFDVTGTNPRSSVALDKPEVLTSLDDLVFDVTATHPPMPAAQSSVSAAPLAADGDMPFVLDFPLDSAAPATSVAAKPAEFDLSEIDLNLGVNQAAASVPPVVEKTEAEMAQWHEVATKLDLAKAYQEMGDAGGAREILDEVMNEGDAEQRAAAQDLLQQLG